VVRSWHSSFVWTLLLVVVVAAAVVVEIDRHDGCGLECTWRVVPSDDDVVVGIAAVVKPTGKK